jgi:predicted phage baseplate assembly protein
MELHTRFRAVTAEDHEMLALDASRLVARARCLEPESGQSVVVRILPVVPEPAGPVPWGDLQPSDLLLDEVERHLDARRMLGTSVQVAPVALRGVTIVVEVDLEPTADPQTVETLVTQALYRYVNPYVGGTLTGEGDGWGFGQPLQAKEVEVLVRGVPGVFAVSMLRLYATDLATGQPAGQPIGEQMEIGPHELVASASHRVRALPAT